MNFSYIKYLPTDFLFGFSWAFLGIVIKNWRHKLGLRDFHIGIQKADYNENPRTYFTDIWILAWYYKWLRIYNISRIPTHIKWYLHNILNVIENGIWQIPQTPKVINTIRISNSWNYLFNLRMKAVGLSLGEWKLTREIALTLNRNPSHSRKPN